VNKGPFLTETLRNFPCDKNNCGLPDLDSPFRTLCLVKEEEFDHHWVLAQFMLMWRHQNSVAHVWGTDRPRGEAWL